MLDQLIRRLSEREPDLVVGDPHDPYLLRWYLFKLAGWQLALHWLRKSDDDRALHDHKSWNVSLILRGGYFEVLRTVLTDSGVTLPQGYWRRPWRMYFRRAETPHRLVLRQPAWTLWLRGPEYRRWGFHCPGGWRDADEYCAGGEPGVSVIGRGCG